jgi:glycosyltransferase involved in cell wall biosynthesis
MARRYRAGPSKSDANALMGIVVGIDASRNRSGGAKAHLVGILGAGDPSRYGISRVHVWSYRALLEALPDAPWLSKHNPPPLERSLVHQAWWQVWSLPAEIRRERCDILLSPDAGTIGGYQPSVVMSRDMLSYDFAEMRRYGWSAPRLRSILLRFIQTRSMRRAHGVIFLTKFAADAIQDITGKLPRVAVIAHGVGETFRQSRSLAVWPARGDEVRCLYVSNADMYKHQWVVVRAIAELRKRGYKISLTLAGGGGGEAQRLVDEEIQRSDPQRVFVRTIGEVPHGKVPGLLAEADLFVFASSCENMPNTLLEGMASELPIACSNRGPMPEVLQDGGVYFTPEDSSSIAGALERIIVDRELRAAIARRAKERSDSYSWARCAEETWSFLRAVAADRAPAPQAAAGQQWERSR